VLHRDGHLAYLLVALFAGAGHPLAPPSLQKGFAMSASDKIKNAAEDLAGKAKEATGNLSNNDEKVAEGKRDQTSASAKQAGENVKDIFKN
jgi:uncharacterized protein YjbJ (UPF0337 family)